MEISTYKNSDHDEIEKLFTQVFSDSEGQQEGLVIGNLVSDLMISTALQDIYGYKAIENNKIIGSIFFTKLTFENSINAFLLSPVAVHTDYQGKGIGQRLISFGINRLKEEGVSLAFTYGDPNYYSKIGFRWIDEIVAKAPFQLTQPQGWLCQSLTDDEIESIKGNSYCVSALSKPEYW